MSTHRELMEARTAAMNAEAKAANLRQCAERLADTALAAQAATLEAEAEKQWATVAELEPKPKRKARKPKSTDTEGGD